MAVAHRRIEIPLEELCGHVLVEDRRDVCVALHLLSSPFAWLGEVFRSRSAAHVEHDDDQRRPARESIAAASREGDRVGGSLKLGGPDLLGVA
jgi:hypothetical protein